MRRILRDVVKAKEVLIQQNAQQCHTTIPISDSGQRHCYRIGRQNDYLKSSVLTQQTEKDDSAKL